MIDKKAFHHMNYGLYIISSHSQEHFAGCVVNTCNQVTSEPARMSVTIHKENDTAKTIMESQTFGVMVLTEEVSMDTIGMFGFRSGKEIDKYQAFETKKDSLGNKYFTSGVNARFTCHVINMVDVGTHMMFIGEVSESEVLGDAPTMTYQYYQSVKKGTTPKNAPSFQEVEKKVSTGTVKWKCKICGYVYEGEELPEDYRCPICGQPASAFEKIEE